MREVCHGILKLTNKWTPKRVRPERRWKGRKKRVNGAEGGRSEAKSKERLQGERRGRLRSSRRREVKVEKVLNTYYFLALGEEKEMSCYNRFSLY